MKKHFSNPKQMPTLTLKLKSKSLGKYSLKKGGSLTIGRRKTNDIVIEDPKVSRQHAYIELTDNGHLLKDLNSTNGVRVSGKRVSELLLVDGVHFHIGDSSFAYHTAKRFDVDPAYEETT